MTRWLRGGALLLHDFGFFIIERRHQILHRFLHSRTFILLQWDLDLPPALEMHVVMLQGQFVDLYRLFRHRRRQDREINPLPQLFAGE